MKQVLLGIDNVCRMQVEAEIAAGLWVDVPVTLRLMLNHDVRQPDASSTSLHTHFNAVVASVRERNVALVNSLAVAYLQAVEVHAKDAEERRDCMDELQLWLGNDKLIYAGKQVAVELCGSGSSYTSDSMDLGERLQELFRPGYGQWFEGVFQAHTFLLGLHARGEHAKVAHVASSLHLLLQSTTPQSESLAAGAGGAAAAAAAAEVAGVGIYGVTEFAVIAADLRRLLSTATLSGSWATMLDNLFALKSRADARLQAYMTERSSGSFANSRTLSSQQLITLLERQLPASRSGRASRTRVRGAARTGGMQLADDDDEEVSADERLAVLKAALPLARAPHELGISVANPESGREVGCLWGRQGGGGCGAEEEEEEGEATLWPLVDAAALYMCALRQLRVLKQATPKQYQARVETLGSRLLQLGRVCVWTALADVGDSPDVCRSSLVAWQEAYARVIRVDSEPRQAARLLDLAATLHLYRITGVLKLRGIWVELESFLPDVEPLDNRGLASPRRPLMDRMVGAYLDVVKSCTSKVALSTAASLPAPFWSQRWCAHAMGLAGLLTDNSLDIMADLSSECIEELLHQDLAFFSFHLFDGE